MANNLNILGVEPMVVEVPMREPTLRQFLDAIAAARSSVDLSSASSTAEGLPCARRLMAATRNGSWRLTSGPKAGVRAGLGAYGRPDGPPR